MFAPFVKAVECIVGEKKRSQESNRRPLFKKSLFPQMPPSIIFYTKGTKVEEPPAEIKRRLKWSKDRLLPLVVRQTLATSHFKLVEKDDEWIGYWGGYFKSAQYRKFTNHQKVNHFPGGYHIARKDNLWRHILEKQKQFPNFEIMPYTFILPDGRADLEQYLLGDEDRYVIVKPPASARGLGIMVTHDMGEIRKGDFVAQQYIDNPLLIDGRKFDLRVYVYVPSLEPLRLYMYEEGLVRFASVPYAHSADTTENLFMHLTNYSINKNAKSQGMTDKSVRKWTLTQLWEKLDKYFEVDEIKALIKDLIVKTFIACEKKFRDHATNSIDNLGICHELFGFDVLLDEDARPHLLEVNVTPAMHSDLPIDVSVKGPLVASVLSMACIRPVTKNLDGHENMLDKASLWAADEETIAKEEYYYERFKIYGETCGTMLNRLTSTDVRILCQFEDEFERRGQMKLIYPTADTHPYLRYFDEVTYPNLLLQQWQIRQALVLNISVISVQGHKRKYGIEHLRTLILEGILDSGTPVEDAWN
ncbi:unnamed protein product, partial [Mesorhabditis spiculigera]